MDTDRWRGATALGLRAGAALALSASDALGFGAGSSLPVTPRAIARVDVLNRLLREHAPAGQPLLPPIVSARLPGVEFESSNCTNFLIEVEFDPAAHAAAETPLPRTLYAKLPCESMTTRVFGNTLGFWPLECTFCARVAPHVPIRVPRVYAAVQQGSRFALLLENLHEIPGARLFINRDMAAGTTPERAERVLDCFAELHAHFHGWPAAERERILPARYNTFTAPRWRGVTRALNAAALEPARRVAPELIGDRLADTYRLALDRWSDLLAAWYRGPLTLVHGDSHLGNCFEYPADGRTRVGLIDFQAVHWSKGMRDVQYFLINSLEPEVLEANEVELIRGYCAALAERGVTLRFEDAWQQYRAFSFQTLTVGVVPLGLGALTERNETVLAVTRRGAAAVERLGFREWVLGLD